MPSLTDSDVEGDDNDSDPGDSTLMATICVPVPVNVFFSPEVESESNSEADRKRTVISQEETESAVNALLGESFDSFGGASEPNRPKTVLEDVGVKIELLKDKFSKSSSEVRLISTTT